MEEWMWAVALVTVMGISVVDSWMMRRRVKYLSKRRFMLEVRLDELDAATSVVADELIAVHAKMDAARTALRDYRSSPAGSAHIAWDALCAALGVDELAADGGVE